MIIWKVFVWFFIAAFVPRDCLDVQLSGRRSSGMYSVYITGNSAPTRVYCDMETSGGGWLVSYNYESYQPSLHCDHTVMNG